MPRADLLIHNAQQLVTCASPAVPKRGAALADAGVIENGAVAIVDGIIVEVGASDEMLAAYAAHSHIDATGKVVTPGFVDCHTHLVFAGDRVEEWERKMQGVPYLDILAAGGGILSTMRATRAATYAHLLATARSRLDTMFALGTTTVEIKTGYGLDAASELKMLRVIQTLAQSHAADVVPTLLAAHATPPEYAANPAAYVDEIIATILPAAAALHREMASSSADSAEGSALPLFCDVYCEEKAFSVADTRRILDAAQRLHMQPKVHVDQFNALGGTTLAAELGAVSADHLDVTPPDELLRLAHSDTIAVLLPAVNFHLGSERYAAGRAWIDAGAAVALATDLNPGSAPCFSMPFVMALACRKLGMTPAEALNASTINAAHALGLGARLGSIEAGKQADLLILDIPDYRQIAYWIAANPVETVIKHGQQSL